MHKWLQLLQGNNDVYADLGIVASHGSLKLRCGLCHKFV